MFLVGSSGCQGDFQIGDFRSGQNSWMLPLCQMGQDQTLPVLIQHIVAALIVENESAAPLTRFQNQMDFRIVAEGLKVAHPFYFLRNGFLVYNASGAKFGTDAEPLFNHAFQDSI